jgi:hypothetical protein
MQRSATASRPARQEIGTVRRIAVAAPVAGLVLALGAALPAGAQSNAPLAAPAPAIELKGSQPETTIPKSRPPTGAAVPLRIPTLPSVTAPLLPSPGAGVTLAPGGAPLQVQVNLVALLTDDGQRIEQGVVWHVFAETGEGRAPRLVTTLREAAPSVRLAPGDYVMTATFGRANLSRRVAVKAGPPAIEQFVLNAGGLRLTTLLHSGGVTPPNATSFEIYSDDRDQSGQRSLVVGGLKPGLIIRLNSGIYHIVSTYGDANAQVRADVTVEAGKLTEATVIHEAARVTLKLVTRAGGEALADTQWSIATAQGAVIKETVGALPSHMLAPGTYSAVARASGRIFRRDFTVTAGQSAQIEVVMQ